MPLEIKNCTQLQLEEDDDRRGFYSIVAHQRSLWDSYKEQLLCADMRDWKLIGNKQTTEHSIFELVVQIDPSRCLSNNGVGAQCLLSTEDELAL